MKNNSQFKTMRHIETVRNYLNSVIKELINRQEQHDQSKMQEPELSIFNEYTPKLRGVDYGSEEYKKYMKEMKIAIKHHHKDNRHHPEHFSNEIIDMNLIDLIEMICDWKSASLRHKTGNIFRSIEINQKRFGYSDELKTILINTVKWIEEQKIYHNANES